MRRNRIATEIALTREEIVKSRETTTRLLAEMDQHNAESRESSERLFAEQDQRNADMRQFMHEKRLHANKMLEPLLVSHGKLIASHDDLVAESRAQREALFRILDELRGNGGGSGEAAA